LLVTEKELERNISEWNNQPVLGLDTEFLRVRTYYPKLCLVQLSSGSEEVCVDPLDETVLDRLKSFLCAYSGEVVMHAAGQDLEVLWQTLGCLPAKLHDTQVAAAMVGLGAQLSYAALVEKLCGVTLPKSETRTDWCQRPLSSAQVDYAQADVRYLSELHEVLTGKLSELDRLEWLEAECTEMLRSYLEGEPDRPPVIRAGADLDHAGRNRLWALINWREARARARDLPREWVVASEELVNLARNAPRNAQDMRAISRMKPRQFDRCAEGILKALHEYEAPAPEGLWESVEMLTGSEKQVVKRLQSAIRGIGEEHEIEPTLIANRKTLERFVRGRPTRLDHGWRRDLTGDRLRGIVEQGLD
jgi:ribonuclease D